MAENVHIIAENDNMVADMFVCLGQADGAVPELEISSTLTIHHSRYTVQYRSLCTCVQYNSLRAAENLSLNFVKTWIIEVYAAQYSI